MTVRVKPVMLNFPFSGVYSPGSVRRGGDGPGRLADYDGRIALAVTFVSRQFSPRRRFRSGWPFFLVDWQTVMDSYPPLFTALRPAIRLDFRGHGSVSRDRRAPDLALIGSSGGWRRLKGWKER